ncbi:MAG TPA: amino acid adenylation domain-containing protein, partial [Candidatus Obscuribacterales bacterium]
NSPMSALEFPGLVPSFINIETKTTRFDLEFHLWESAKDYRSIYGEQWQQSESIRGVVVYNTDLFDKATIVRMLGHFKTLLSGIVANPENWISALPILTDAEQHQILVKFNQPQFKIQNPKSKIRQCIHHLFENKVEQNFDGIAVVFENEQITYREINKRSNQLGHYLQKMGVGSEVLVGICVERFVDMIVGLLGILKAGGAYVPLDPSYPRDRLAFMLEDAQVSVLLTQEKLQSKLPNLPTKVICLDKDWDIIAQESKENPKSDTVADNLAYVIYTSGSTGTPKGVAVSHKAVTRLVCNTNYVELDATDKIAQVSNFSFDAATFEIWGALLNGAQLVGISRDITLSPQDFALQIRQKDISVLFLTTALFQQMARDVPQAFTSLRYLLFGGEAVDPRWVKKVIAKGAPKQLLHVYGPTESTTFTSYYVVSEEETNNPKSTIPIGRPITNTQIYLLDEQLQPVPIGVTGELYIGGDGLARGYLNRPELTAEKFIPNPISEELTQDRLYKTGDLGRYLPDGNIEFLGRIDDQVKIRGFRIELGEIEAVLNQHPAVAETVVIIQEDIPDDKHLVAYIVPTNPKSKIQNPKSDVLRQFLKEKLPGYMVPSAYVVLKSLPLTPNGKVDRRALPAVDTASLDVKEDYVAPRTSVEGVLVGIWSKVLGREQIGVHDNFFDLGGHSLLATQLISRIRDAFQVELPVSQVFEAPSIASLARYIETMRWATKNQQAPSTTENAREEVEF